MEAHDEQQSIGRFGGSMLHPGTWAACWATTLTRRADPKDVFDAGEIANTLSHGWWVDDVVRVP